MKLIIENWRKYLNEETIDYGPLYIFEGDNVKQTSFYDALHMLNENEEDSIETFLENWERSVDYHIEQLNENALADMADNPVLYLSTQAFLFLDKVKDKVIKYADKVIGIINKIRAFLKRFEQENPMLYKIGSFLIKVIVAILVMYAISYIFGGGQALAGDSPLGKDFPYQALAGDLTATDVGPDGFHLVDKVIATKEQLKIIGKIASEVGLEEIGKEITEMANSPQNTEVGIFKGQLSRNSDTYKVIMRGVAKLEQNEQTRELAKVAAEAAKNATETFEVTITDPEMLAQQAKLKAQLKASGL